jgi:hypothetical protein
MAAFTLVGMGGGGWLLITQVQDRDALALLLGPWHWGVQSVIGIGAGIIIAWVAWWIIARPDMAEVRMRYAGLVRELMPDRSLQLAVSLSAGIGEELFFRGALQHWLGIPLTAVLFVALHGYLPLRNIPLFRYGLYLTFAMLGIGWAADHCGLLLAMAAHAVIDAVLIRRLVGEAGDSEKGPPRDP